MSPPKIIHLASELTGGAGIAALRLHENLLNLGWDSGLVFGKGQTAVSGTLCFQPSSRLPLSYADRLVDQLVWRSIRESESLFTRTRRFVRSGIDSAIADADLVHIHWIAKWLDLPTLFEAIPARTPVVISLHDANFFTGGCHQPDGCHRFVSECSACPKLTRRGPFALDIARAGFRARISAYRGKNITVVPNSDWTAALAKRGTLLESAAFVDPIFPGVNTTIFSPLDKAICREILSIPTDRFVIVAGCADLFDANKGISILLDSVARLPADLRSKAAILTYGSGKLPSHVGEVPVFQVGFVGSERLLALVYSAGDVYCTPSLMETFGMTIVEALSCGIPVVAFETGAIPEIIRHRDNGWLARTGDVNALIEGLEWAFSLSSPGKDITGVFRSSVVDRFDISQTGKCFVGVYASLLQSQGREEMLPQEISE